MKVIETDFKGLFIVNHKIFEDTRGCFKEVFRKNIFEEELGYQIKFCQENIVKSKKNVLRGLHYQDVPFAQSKLVSVQLGEIFDVAVDLRKESKTYGKYFSYNLKAENNESIFIPKGFAHGYLSLSELSIVKYKVDNYYNKSSEKGISFDDKFLKIEWGIPVNEIIISKKDKELIDFIW
tara:strand:- start:202 stop:738 length:537 start_codon:yes stop_codon:yes gene_type:complete